MSSPPQQDDISLAGNVPNGQVGANVVIAFNDGTQQAGKQRMPLFHAEGL
jgi:hypothetical protein